MKLLIPLFGILLIILLLRLFFYYDSRPEYINGDVVRLSHTLLSEPRRTAYYQIVRIDNIKVYLPLLPRFHYGDTIEVEGRVQEVSYISKNNDSLITELQIKNPQVQNKPQNEILAVVSFIRQRVSYIVHSYLPSREASLLLGIVFGIREGIDQQTYDSLRRAGLLHVVAASGANVSIVTSFLLFITSRFMKRKVSYLFVVGGVVLYALLSGFDASILRASLMAGITFIALSFGRQSFALVSLFLTSFILLFISPKLVEDLSFQLSFMATFGIVQMKPLLDSLKAFRLVPVISEDLTTTLSAQIGVFPVVIAVFKTFSLFSVVINLLVLWTIPFVMMFGGIGVLAGFIFDSFSAPFLYLSYPLLSYFLFIVRVIEPFSYEIQFQNVSLFFITGYILLLMAVVLRYRKNT